MTRIGLAVLVVLLLAAGHASATVGCGLLGDPCCPSGVLPDDALCAPGFVCDPNNIAGCDLVWLGGGDGGAAQVVCLGTCVRPTATPTSTATNTPTTTPTPTPHGLPDTDPCTDSRQCASALCNGGMCATANPAPAVSNRNAVFMGAALLLAGLWSVRRIARRR